MDIYNKLFHSNNDYAVPVKDITIIEPDAVDFYFYKCLGYYNLKIETPFKIEYHNNNAEKKANKEKEKLEYYLIKHEFLKMLEVLNDNIDKQIIFNNLKKLINEVK